MSSINLNGHQYAEIPPTVTSVIDGDSFYIVGDEVRFGDVSCPEWNEYGGPEATTALISLIKGKTVYLDTDQWNRPKITHAKILVYMNPQRVTPLKSMITQLKKQNIIEILDLSSRI